MVSFLSKNGNTAMIRIICGEQARINASIYGGDSLGLDDILNDINNDDNIKHVNLSVGFYEDEDLVMEKIKGDHLNKNRPTLSGVNKHSEEDESEECCDEECHNHNNKNVQKNKNDFKCPECGGDDCLVDRYGNKYPCISCMQIDIGQKLTKLIGEKFSKTVDKNNDIIKAFIDLFKSQGK